MPETPPPSARDLAALATRTDKDHTSCLAHVEFTEDELDILSRDSRALFTQIPFSGPGYECYGYDGDGWHHYGRSSTIQAVLYICTQWAKKYPDAPRIGVGDISMADGGNTPRHGSHEEGVDVDFALVTNNGKEEPSNWRAANYSRELTKSFIDLIFNNPVLAPRVILFNDPNIAGVQYYGGHDDHIHVRFQIGPNVPAAPGYTPANEASMLRLMAPYLQGDVVKTLQENLTKAGIAVEVDGVFGKGTETAVKTFQEKSGLTADGVAGKKTLAKLAEAAGVV